MASGEKCVTLLSICRGQPRITFRWTSPCTQERSEPTALGLLIFLAHGSLNLSFSVCQTLGYIALFSLNCDFSSRKTDTPLFTVLLCACALSVSSPCDPMSRDCHFIDENTVAQRLACSAQLVNGKARLGTQVFPCQAPTWQPPF